MDTETMQKRALGNSGASVGAIGVGTMGWTGQYGHRLTEAEARRMADTALDAGATLFDTAAAYGHNSNEVLVGRAIAHRREQVMLATKCGYVLREESAPVLTGADLDGSPARLREECEDSLRRLDTDHIDLYYMHRLDPKVPVEESVGALAELIKEGKVRYIGLCEVDIETAERAMAVHPLSAIQSELSLWTREPLDDVVPWCSANGVTFVPYSPLGRGFLSGRYRSTDDFGDADYRRDHQPRLQDEALTANLKLVDRVAEIGKPIGATSAQVALAWILASGDNIVPIQGADRLEYLEENLAAGNLRLGTDAMASLDELPPAVGERY